MKKIVLGTAVALVAALSLGSSQSIAAGTAATCGIAGATGSITPSVQLVGGSGSFTFSGNVVCQINGAPVIGTLSASGTFNNTVCGTGTATGSATIPNFGTRSFSIQFVAGLGVVTVDGSGVSGAVQLIPTGPDTSGPPNCVKQFTVVGGFSVN